MNYAIECSADKSRFYIMLKGLSPVSGKVIEVMAYPSGLDSKEEALHVLNMMQGGNPAPRREPPYRREA